MKIYLIMYSVANFSKGKITDLSHFKSKIIMLIPPANFCLVISKIIIIGVWGLGPSGKL